MPVSSHYENILPLKGQCYCGLVTYEITAPPLFVNCCHCRDCQHLSGSAFAINLKMAAENVIVTSGIQPTLKESAPSSSATDDASTSSTDQPASQAAYCQRCDTMLWGTVGKFGPQHIYVRAGTLQRGEIVVPSAHFFTRSKHPWIVIPDGVPSFETLPSAEQARSLFGKE